MKINNVEVSVLVGGRPVKFFGHNGKTYISASYGAEYEIKIRNDNGYRVMAVVSVDGLSVLDGKPANKDGVGYVLSAYSSYSVKGFRKDQDTVGAFKFTKKKKGYAKEVTGSAENSGVIAVAVFAEKRPVYWNNSIFIGGTTLNERSAQPSWFTEPSYTTCSLNSDLIGRSINTESPRESAVGAGSLLRSMSAGCGQSASLTNNGVNSVNYSFCSSVENATKSVKAQNAAPDFNAATTWGSKLQDSVTNTTFEKASAYPMAEFNIYYDIRQNLEKIGISFETPKQVAFPKPFPQGFATPPAGWQS